MNSRVDPRIPELADRLVGIVRSNPPAATDVLAEMEKLAGGGDRHSRAYCKRAHGNILQVEGKLSEAIRAYRDALDDFRAENNLIEAARTASSLVGALAPAGEFDEALRQAAFARGIFMDAGLVHRAARLDVNVGNIYHRLGQLEQAYDQYERVMPILVQSGDIEAAAGVMINRSILAMLLFRFDQALDGFREATAYCRHHKLNLLETQSEYNRAYLLYLMGRTIDALKILQDVERAFESHGDRFHVAQTRLDRADILAELNLHEDALLLSTEAQSIFDSLGANADSARALMLVGRCWLKARDFPKAITIFRKAKSLFEAEGNRVWSWLVELEYCAILLTQRNFSEAAGIAARAGDALRREGHAVYGIQADLFAAQAAVEEHRIDEAGAILAGIDFDSLPVWLRYHAHYLSGRIKESSSDIAGAIAMYKAAVANLRFLSEHIGIDDFLLRFSVNKRDPYSRLVRLLDDDTAAFEYADSLKAVDTQSSSREYLSNAHLPARSQELRQLLRADYVELFQKTGSATGALLDRIREREREFLSTSRSERIDAFSPSSASGSIGTATLGEDETLVEFFFAEREVFAFAVTREGVSRVLFPADRDQLEREIAFLRHYFSVTQNGAQRRLESHLRNLYSLLIAPLESALRARVVVVPDGCLNDLPFHALIGPQGYLFDQFVFSYAPAADAYVKANQSIRRPTTTAVVIGLEAEGLPSVAREVDAVSAQLKGARVFRGRDASGAVAVLSSAAVIHVASHGMFRSDSPALTMLLLGSDVMTAADVPRLDLQAELITMSACSTGRGSGFEGFLRAFMRLGVPSMVVSLWDVDDTATALLMQAFYPALIETADIGTALCSAMRKIQASYDHPFYWAPFCVFGRTRLHGGMEIFQTSAPIH